MEDRAVYDFDIENASTLKEIVQNLEEKSYKENILNANMETFVRENERLI